MVYAGDLIDQEHRFRALCHCVGGRYRGRGSPVLQAAHLGTAHRKPWHCTGVCRVLFEICEEAVTASHGRAAGHGPGDPRGIAVARTVLYRRLTLNSGPTGWAGALLSAEALVFAGTDAGSRSQSVLDVKGGPSDRSWGRKWGQSPPKIGPGDDDPSEATV